MGINDRDVGLAGRRAGRAGRALGKRPLFWKNFKSLGPMERHLCLGLAVGFSCLMVMNLSPEQSQIKAISVGLRLWYSFSSRAPITGIGFPVGGAGPGHLNPPPPRP